MNDIQRFRRVLRRFERLSQLIDTGCCTGISNAQCHVLLEIENHGEITTRELTANLLLDKSTLSRTIDNLVRLGFVERRENRSDRRYKLLHLSANGREKCDEINLRNNRTYERILNTIQDKSNSEIMDVFELMVTAMRDCYEDPSGGSCSCR